MKQLLILSGKGGTGKTTVAGAFIHLSQAEAFADCDVDAPNLHLISSWEIRRSIVIIWMPLAQSIRTPAQLCHMLAPAV